MFFVITVIYYSLKLLQSSNEKKETIPLALCGFLSLYVLPTNVFFLIGMATWLTTILLIPSIQEEYGIPKEGRQNKIIYFFGAGVFIALTSFLAYSPVLEEMLEYTNTHPLMTFDTKTGSVFSLAPAILEKIFQGPLLWFFPFLIAGCFFGSQFNRPRLLLLLIIFFIPLLITLATGIGGYPRNYLFNLPVFILFLSAGFYKVGGWIENRIGENGEKKYVAGLITVVYTMVSLGLVLSEYYPSMQVPDSTSYQRNIRQQTHNNELLLITDPKNYLYARTIFKNTLSQIIKDNKLNGVKAILPISANIEEYKTHTTKGPIPLFKGLLNSQNLASVSLDSNRKIVSISEAESISAFPKDFEAESKWETVSGKGEVLKLDTHVFSGKQSLEIQASAEQNIVAGTSIQESISIDKPSLIVMTWARKKFARKAIAYHPILIAQTEFNGIPQTLQMLTGKINDGINIQIKEKPGSSETYHWFVNASIGIIPPGNYKFQLMLKCDAGQRILYDGLRLFFISLA